jgi:hypothetical protein
VIYADIQDPSAEAIFFLGIGDLSIFTLDGDFIAELKGSDAGNYTDLRVLSEGTYLLELSENQPQGWGIAVINYKDLTENPGRIYSRSWHFEAATSSEAIEHSFYVATPLHAGASSTEQTLHKVYIDDVTAAAGEELILTASRTGSRDAPFTSLPPSGYEAPEAELDLYLGAPSGDFVGEAELSMSDLSVTTAAGSCADTILPGYTTAEIAYTSDQPGVRVFGCDLNDSGELDVSGAEDPMRFDELEEGAGILSWDGGDLDPGSYTCALGGLRGTLAVTLYNAATAYPGVRLFQLNAGSSFTAADMHWNDLLPLEALASSDPKMLNGALPEGYTTGTDGVSSGQPTVSTRPGDNAHSWGNFVDESRGSGSWLTTWTALDGLMLGEFMLSVGDVVSDIDGDGLGEDIEGCLLGTDASSADTDGDGLEDKEEVGGDVFEPTDTDGDSLIDALDDDDDDDEVSTLLEVNHAEVYGDDIDDDGLSNWHDQDSDGDGILDGDEVEDSDGNGVPDYLEVATDAPTGASGSLSGGAFSCASLPATTPRRGGLWFLILLATGWRGRARRG